MDGCSPPATAIVSSYLSLAIGAVAVSTSQATTATTGRVHSAHPNRTMRVTSIAVQIVIVIMAYTATMAAAAVYLSEQCVQGRQACPIPSMFWLVPMKVAQ